MSYKYQIRRNQLNKARMYGGNYGAFTDDKGRSWLQQQVAENPNFIKESDQSQWSRDAYYHWKDQERIAKGEQPYSSMPSVNNMKPKGATVTPDMLDPKYTVGDYGLLQRSQGMVAQATSRNQVAQAVQAAQRQARGLQAEAGFATNEQVKSGQFQWGDQNTETRRAQLADPNFYKNNEITKYTPAQQQEILADPNFQWDKLPNLKIAGIDTGFNWQKAYFEFSSKPIEIKTPLGDLQINKMAATQGGLMGGPAGAVLGVVGGMTGYDQTKEWWQQGDRKFTFDKQQIKDTVNAGFGLMNWLAEGAEKAIGTGVQIGRILTNNDPNFDPTKRNLDITLNKDFNLTPGEKFNPDILKGSTWEAGGSAFEVMAPAVWESMKEYGVLDNILEGKALTKDEVGRIAANVVTMGFAQVYDLITNPEKYKGTELYLGAEKAVAMEKTYYERLDEVKTRIQNGEDYRAVMTDMQNGIIAQVGDMVGQAAVDPLNVLPQAKVDAYRTLADASGNKVLSEAYRGASSPLEAKQKYKTMVQTGQALTIDPNFKAQDYQGTLQKFLGGDVGVNKRGEVKAGSVLPTETGLLDPVKERQAGLVGWVQNMAEQTPHSRAQQAAGMFYENIGAMLTMMDTPEDAAKYLNALAGNDMETFAELGGKFANSPEFYTVLPALKAFATEKLQGTVRNWEQTAGNRDMLTRLADTLGEEPGRLLEDLARNGTAEQDFARVVERLKNSTDPQAKALLADVESGRFTADTLSRTVDIFTGDDALNWHPSQWKADMLDQLGEHFDKWTAERLMLDKSPEATSAFFRTTALMKQAQSILLLGGSPGYAITNGLSNMVHRAATGIYGYMTPGQVNGFLEKMGFTPARMDEGVGIGGMVEGGKSQVKTSAIDKAMKGKGPLTTAKNVLGKISKGMPFSKLSSWFEANESKQAFAIGMKQFWSQSWRRGTGFSTMSPDLTQAIRNIGVDPNVIYSAIEAGMNQADIERVLYGREAGVQARSLVNDAAQKSGMSAGQAADMLEKAGVLDALESRLQGRTTADGVRQAFAGIRRQAQDWADMQTGEDLKAIAENVKQRVGLEGATAALDVVQKAHGVFTDAWLDHYSRFGDVMNDLQLLDEQRSKAIELAYKQSDDEFRRVYARHAANYQGIFEVWGMSGNQNAMRMLNAIGDVDDAMRNAYQQMREIRRGFFEKYADDYDNPGKWDEWEANDRQIDRIFKQAFETKRKAETAQGEALGNIYGDLYGPAAGEAARQWWEEVVAFNDEMVQREKDFRDSLKDMDAEDKRIAKQEYYQKDKVGMIVEADRINAEGIARLERAIKNGPPTTDGGQTPTQPPTPSPVDSRPSTDAQGEATQGEAAGGFKPAEVTDAQRVKVIKDAEAKRKKQQQDRVEEFNALMKDAEQRDAREKAENAERVASVWDVAEGGYLTSRGEAFDRTILQHRFNLLGSLAKEEYGGIPDLKGLEDPRLTKELVKEILDRRQAVNEAEAGKQVAQAMTNAQAAVNSVKAPRIDENTRLLKAMAEHGGLNTQHIPDITGNKRQKSMFGAFRKEGIGLDEMARLLADDGYPIDLNDPNDPGGIGQVTALIQKELNKEKVYPVGHDYEAALAKAQNEAAEKAFDDSFDFENVDIIKWQDDFDAAIKGGDLSRMNELIAQFPEELNKTLAPSGETWDDYLSRMASEAVLRVEADELYQRTYEHRARAQEAINAQEVRAEAVTARQLMKEKFTDAFGLTEQQAEAYMELSDAFAGWVSKSTGADADEFYSRYYGEVGKADDGRKTVDGGLGALFQEAYHGSPYKFDKFSLDHMGSGEGAQAYGWGLYFAGDQKVADWYRETLSREQFLINQAREELMEYDAQEGNFWGDSILDERRKINKSIKESEVYNEENDTYTYTYNNKELVYDYEFDPNSKKVYDREVSEAFVSDEEIFNKFDEDEVAFIVDEYIKDLQNSGSFDDVDVSPSSMGQLYRVEIPDQTYLLWDRPLSEQPQAVRDVLPEIGLQSRGKAYDWKSSLKMGEAYRQIAADFGGQKAASLALKEAGINGIQYLDGSSRGKGEGSYNYVIFDDAAIQIMETYYQSQGRGTIKGAMRWDYDSMKASITAFEAADFTTLVHENAHVFRKVIADVANRTSNAQIKADLRTLEEWAGATDGVWNRAAEEKFARGFENYVTTGKAPLPKLKAVFESIREWMLDVYRNITGSAIDVKITDDVRRVFDRMLGAENLRIDLRQMIQEMGYDPTQYYVDVDGGVIPIQKIEFNVDRQQSLAQADDLVSRVKNLQKKMESGERVISGAEKNPPAANVKEAIQSAAEKAGVGPLTDGQVDKLLPMSFDAWLDNEARQHHYDDWAEMQHYEGGSAMNYRDAYDAYLKAAQVENVLTQQKTARYGNTAAARERAMLGDRSQMNKLQLMQAGLYEPGDYARGKYKTPSLLFQEEQMDMFGNPQASFDFAQDEGQVGGLLPGMQEATGMMFDVQPGSGTMRKMEMPKAARTLYDVDPSRTASDSQGVALKAGDIVTDANGKRYNVQGANMRGKVLTRDGKILEPSEVTRVARQETLFQEASEPAGQRVNVVETPEFKRWFGDSKVVDEQGNPLVVYHGGSNWDVLKMEDTMDGVLFMAEHYPVAVGYAGGYSSGEVKPLYVKMEKPLDMTDPKIFEKVLGISKDEATEKSPYRNFSESVLSHFTNGTTENFQRILQYAKENGHDGLIIFDKDATGHGAEKTYVVMNDTQVKLAKPTGAETEYSDYGTKLRAEGNRGTFDPADPNILFQEADQPFGAYDAAAQFHPQSEVMDAGWAQSINPLLDAMEETAVQRVNDPASRMDGMRDLSPEGQKMLRGYMNRVKTEMATNKLATVRYAEGKRDFAMLNYSRRYGFDRVLETVYPYQFYQTRTMVNWAARAIDNPAILANYARLQKQQNRYERDIPERLRGKIKIPAAWLPDWMGDALYIDPIGNLFPPAALMKPVNRMMQDHNYQQIEAERVLQEWAADGQYTNDEIVQAAQSRSGKVWERAFAEAQMRREAEVNNPMDFFNSMFGPAWYLTTPYKLATGKGSEVTSTPLGNTSRALETVTKGTWAEPVGQVFGLLGKAENWAKKKLGIPEMGEYGDYYIDRQLANMVADGLIDSDTAQTAMIERQGEIFEQAKERVNMELAMRVPLAGTVYAGLHGGIGDAAKAALPSLFGAGLLPSGELEYRGLKQEWNDAWKRADAGDKTAINDFFEEHPEYEAFLAKGKEPEDRLKSFLIGKIWDGYMELGPTNQRQARNEMGDLFQQSFLDKETRSYDTLTVEQLTAWAQMLGQKTPQPQPQLNVERPTFNAPEPTKTLDLYDPKVTSITDRFFEQRTANFPNYYEKQAAYYALTTKGERATYLAKNPDLKAYFDWKNKWYDAYPQYKPIFNGQAFKQVDTSGWPPALEDYVANYAYTGKRMPSGAYKALEQVWIQEGMPMGNFQEWIDAEVVPAMLYGGQ